MYDNTPNDKHKSEWIYLEKGKAYYIKGDHADATSAQHFTVSVEIKPESQDSSVASEHPKSTHTITQLAMDQSNTFEEWYFTVTNPDNGKYKLNLLNPTKTPNTLWKSGSISAKASASQFYDAIKSYYSDVWKSGIDVTRDMYDASGNLTTVAANAVSYRYTVKMRKVITGFSTNAVSATPEDSKSTFTATPPLLGI